MENPFQLDFMQRLRDMLPGHYSLADQLSEILQISQDSAYRRIRGETAMSIDEAITLCNHYKIPIAYFTDEIKGLVNFKYVVIEGSHSSFIKHVDFIYQKADELLNHDNRRIQYATNDIPLFLQFAYEPLARFKMHFWMHEFENIGGFKEYYDANDVDKEIIDITKKIYEVYLMIPSDEIWPENILHSTLKQINYYWDADYFRKKSDVEELLDCLVHLVDHAEEMAACSHKMRPNDRSKQKYAEFNLYQTDILLGNNTVLSIADDKRTSYLSHRSFGILITNSFQYAAESELWMRSILGKSNLISGISEKNRSKYFRILRKNIETAREKMGI